MLGLRRMPPSAIRRQKQPERAAQNRFRVPENAELVRAWQAAANDGRIKDLLALSHPEFEMTEPSALPGAAHVRGLDALRSYSHGWGRNWSEWEWLQAELGGLPPRR